MGEGEMKTSENGKMEKVGAKKKKKKKNGNHPINERKLHQTLKAISI
jgi:hypothetical protein